MSGIKKYSTNSSEEVEIPLDMELEEKPIEIKVENTKLEPEYYECDNNYSVFEQ